jgi:hypothetical protein
MPGGGKLFRVQRAEFGFGPDFLVYCQRILYFTVSEKEGNFPGKLIAI